MIVIEGQRNNFFFLQRNNFFTKMSMPKHHAFSPLCLIYLLDAKIPLSQKKIQNRLEIIRQLNDI